VHQVGFITRASHILLLGLFAFKILQNIIITHSKTQHHYQENFTNSKNIYLQHFFKTSYHRGNDLNACHFRFGEALKVQLKSTVQSLLERKRLANNATPQKQFHCTYRSIFLKASPAEKQKVGSCWSAAQ
jgi:hypothetical protein